MNCCAAGASVVEGKEPKTVNSEKWQPLASISLTEAGEAVAQWTEYCTWYTWDSDENEDKKW